MKVVSIPGRLRLATMLTMLCIPLAAVEVILVAQAPWWNLPYQKIELWSGAVALMSIPLAVWMANGKKWALYVTGALGIIWVAVTVWLAIRLRSFWLAIFGLGLSLFWLTLWVWIRYEINRSFFEPYISWYQGLPQPIPGLKCEAAFKLLDAKRAQPVKTAAPSALKEPAAGAEVASSPPPTAVTASPTIEVSNFRVSRLDRDGTFLFQNKRSAINDTISQLKFKKYVNLAFSYRGREIQCQGVPVRILESGLGLGLRFSKLTPDARKQLGDFVEALRGEGYVQ